LREGGSVIRRLNRNDGKAGNDLTALARAGVPIAAGSVTSSSEVRKRMIAQAGFRLFPRGPEGFAPLAERSGYPGRREPQRDRERASAAAVWAWAAYAMRSPVAGLAVPAIGLRSARETVKALIARQLKA
jgi:hypothetical protein